MTNLQITASQVNVVSTEPIVTGSVGIYQVSFTFDAVWDDLTKLALFSCGNVTKSKLIDENNQCDIPWEVLVKENAWKPLVVGVYGTDGSGRIIRPTSYGIISTSIQPGVESADLGVMPTPDIVQQMMSVVRSAEQIAQSVRDDADSGAFTPEFSIGTVTTGEAGSNDLANELLK